jgi:hypothetical protein
MRSIAFLLIPLFLCAATKERNWKVGHVTADSSINGNEYLQGAASHNRAIDPHFLQVQGDDVLYTAREKHAWNGWCLLIQGEQIKYAVDGPRLFVTDADGQKCQLDILSQQKAITPTSRASTDPSPH